MADEEMLDGIEDTTEAAKISPLSSSLDTMKFIVYGTVILLAVAILIAVSLLTYRIMAQRIINPDAIGNKKPDAENMVKEFQYYDLIPQVHVKINNEEERTLIVRLELGHDANNAVLATELTKKQSPLTEVIRNFFMSKTEIELSIEREGFVKEELVNKINSRLIHGKIEKIIFTEFQIIPTL